MESKMDRAMNLISAMQEKMTPEEILETFAPIMYAVHQVSPFEDELSRHIIAAYDPVAGKLDMTKIDPKLFGKAPSDAGQGTSTAEADDAV